jgi:hypothetical protein
VAGAACGLKLLAREADMATFIVVVLCP